MKIGVIRFLFSILFLFLSLAVFSRQLIVCSSGCNFPSIQSAVNAATDGDTILVKINGRLTESNIRISKNLVIRGLNAVSTVVQAHSLRGAARHRVFYITDGAVVTIEHLTIENGKETADPSLWRGAGGGILIDGNSTAVTLTDVVVRHCDNAVSGGAGGGLALGGNFTSVDMSNCIFDNNVSNDGGGAGIYLAARSGDCLVRNSQFKNNIAANGNGGAVLMTDEVTATFIGCGFTGNEALNGYSGGALYTGNAVPTFNNCIFSGNLAQKEGGALRVGGADIANCSFYYNSALNGGAISRAATAVPNDLYISNCTLLNNAATGYGKAGAGLHNASPSTGLIHMINTVIDKSTAGTDLYLYTASTLSTNQKNHVGRALFTTGSTRFSN